LIPRAIGYSADLIDYFFKGIDVRPGIELTHSTADDVNSSSMAGKLKLDRFESFSGDIYKTIGLPKVVRKAMGRSRISFPLLVFSYGNQMNRPRVASLCVNGKRLWIKTFA
jgi:hypothetical protein